MFHVFHTRRSQTLFDVINHLQTSCTSNDTKMAPCYANVFILSIEQTFIKNLFYSPFINDICLNLGYIQEKLKSLRTEPIQIIPLRNSPLK